MQDHHVPSIGLGYWVTFAVATIFGANLSDMLTMHLALASPGRIVLLAGLLFAVLLVERYDRSNTHLWYWAAIVILQAAASRLADLSTDSLGLRRLELIASVAVLLVATFVTARSSASMLVETLIMSRRGEARPMSDTAYWITMFFASFLGVLGAEVGEHRIGMVPSLAAFAVGFVALLWLSRWPAINRLLLYWLIVLLLRAFGGVAASYLVTVAFAPAGLGSSTILTATILAGCILLWSARSRPRPHA
ncbi:MAG: hypothetical protein KIT25_03985 [Enhydrobacter sp.]|nr:MAG: hypothetical protein KIT25_03985 [Enhydrobacter sp.]